MKRVVFCGIMLVLLGCSATYAISGIKGGALADDTAGGPMGGKFAAADTDKDGFLSKEEFAAAFPGLKPEAFGLIDKDGDGKISAGEWASFYMGHGGSKPPPSGEGSEKGGEALPVVPVPQGTGKE